MSVRRTGSGERVIHLAVDYRARVNLLRIRSGCISRQRARDSLQRQNQRILRALRVVRAGTVWRSENLYGTRYAACERRSPETGVVGSVQCYREN